jgi:hypothetical protein
MYDVREKTQREKTFETLRLIFPSAPTEFPNPKIFFFPSQQKNLMLGLWNW